MAIFQYEGRTVKGKKKNGRITASNQKEAILELKKTGIMIHRIEEKPENLLNKDLAININVTRGVRLKDFVIYLRQFATLLRAGVSITESTRILAQQTESKSLKFALLQVEEDLRSGIPLSESANKHPKVFPNMYINLVAAGEASGKIDESLDELADYYEKQHHLRQKVKAAMTYPIIISILATGVIIFLLAKVVPTFVSMFDDLGAELPLITRFVIGTSSFMQSFWWVFILLFVVIYVGIVTIKSKSTSKFYLDYVILKMPLFGKLMQKASIAKMTRTLSSLFQSSVPIIKSVSIAEKVVDNEVIAGVLKDARKALEGGESLATPMHKHWVFPPLVTQMIVIGEKTGALDSMLGKVADFYEAEVENTTEQLKALIEPLMIMIIGAVVGTIVIAIMVPMFQMYSVING
ncbi:type II secretion system F family protein [Massilibacterium senegalense]|uniref:type II secretion system F family protein n=1 Tax=Massilibacterium senegalense TaxID=1632858 RepID=UPI0007823618|nr:type II secretion system F family protein [Massilibacterium senegalense]